MYGNFYGPYHSGLWGLAMMALFWIVVIAAAVGVVRMLTSSRSSPPGGSAPPPDTAEEILKKRYARGEISKEEFREMRRELSS